MNAIRDRENLLRKSLTFKPPVVQVGDTIRYFSSVEYVESPSAAIVLGVNNQTITAAVFDEMSRVVNIKDGVRHIEDPAAEISENGVWDHSVTTLQLNQRIAELESAIRLEAAKKKA